MTEESMRTRFDTGSRRPLAGLGLVLLSVVLLGVGCSQYEPFEPTPIDEIPDGPGLFTGKTGKWSIVEHGRLWPQSGSAEAQEAPSPQMSPAAPPSPAPEKTVPEDVEPEQEQRKKPSVPL
jgi:hypothetical protein